MTQRGPILVAGTLGVASVVASMMVGRLPMLVWNATASAPVGLYRVTTGRDPQPGDWVLALPPAAVAPIFARRGYLPLGVPLLKPVAATAGQVVCALGDRIWIDGQAVAAVLDRDGRGRPLPHWTGCRTLSPGAVFLLNADVPASLDGRYFGEISSTFVIGRATPLWIPASR